MRTEFVKYITERSKSDSSLILLTADLGFGIFDNFIETSPKHFINVGVSEQNMSSIAAGLSLQGRKVFTYSIGNFPTLRCLEQIRNDICYHNLNVTIVSTGAGFSYGQLGMTHFATEDVAIMRALPNLTVVSPCCNYEMKQLLAELDKIETPKYLRIDKSKIEPAIERKISLGQPNIIHSGSSEIAFICTGGIVLEAIKARKELMSKGIDPDVISLHTLKPINIELMSELISKYKLIITLEEHNIIGGVGSIISEIITDLNFKNTKLIRMGIPDEYSTVVGDQHFLRKHYKLCSENLVENVLSFLKNKI